MITGELPNLHDAELVSIVINHRGQARDVDVGFRREDGGLIQMALTEVLWMRGDSLGTQNVVFELEVQSGPSSELSRELEAQLTPKLLELVRRGEARVVVVHPSVGIDFEAVSRQVVFRD